MYSKPSYLNTRYVNTELFRPANDDLLLLEFTYTLFYPPPLPEVADETQKRIWRQNEFPIGVFQVFHLAMKE